MPMLPEAPLRLSMTMRVPSCAPSGSPLARAVRRRVGVPARGGARGALNADVAGGAAAVVDDEARAELRAERLADEARRDVDAAPWRERRDQADRLAGIALGGRELRQQQGHSDEHPTQH